MPRAQFKHRYSFSVDAPNIAGNYRVILFEKIYEGKPIFTVISNIGEDVQYRVFQLSVLCEKCDAARHYAVIYFKWQKQGSLSSLRPRTGEGLHRFF
jgi:hypothetical protein